jgi:hypothetical protein
MVMRGWTWAWKFTRGVGSNGEAILIKGCGKFSTFRGGHLVREYSVFDL